MYVVLFISGDKTQRQCSIPVIGRTTVYFFSLDRFLYIEKASDGGGVGVGLQKLQCGLFNFNCSTVLVYFVIFRAIYIQ